MPSGFTTGGADLDDVFDPYVEGTKPAATGYTAAGIDLNQRYAPLTYGAAAAATGMKIAGGADCNTLWAAKGSAAYSLAIAMGFGSNYVASGIDASDASGYLKLTVKRDGTWAIVLDAVGTASHTSGGPLSGSWASAPAADLGDEYEVQFIADMTPSGGADASNYTASTGWMPITMDRLIEVSCGYLSETSGVPTAITGTYDVRIRPVGASAYQTSQLHLTVSANIS